jgi:hypothetical protein
MAIAPVFLALLVAILVGNSACEDGPSSEIDGDAITVDASGPHADAEEFDIQPPHGDTAADSADTSDNPADTPRDSTDRDTSDELPTYFFRDQYLCDSAQSPTPKLESSRPFSESTRGGGGPLSQQDVLDARGGVIDADGSWMSAPSELAPGPNGYALWAKDGEDIILYTGAFTKETDLDGARLKVTAMVDYEPVMATYRMWDPDRQEILEERTSTGISLAIDTQVEVVDIVIASETFDEDRMYELSVAHVLGRHGITLGRHFARVTLYKGAYDLPTHPCMEPVRSTPYTSVEQDILRSGNFGTVTLYPTPLESAEDLDELIPAEPGQTIPLDFFVRNSTLSNPKSIGLVPTLNGEPLDKRWFLFRPGYESSGESVLYRGHFEVTLGQEPGIYEVMMTRWELPFMPIEDHQGSKTDPPYGRHGGGSRTLRFEVQ